MNTAKPLPRLHRAAPFCPRERARVEEESVFEDGRGMGVRDGGSGVGRSGKLMGNECRVEMCAYISP